MLRTEKHLRNEPPEYYLGIDGDASVTTFLLTDKNLDEVRRTTLEGCNPIDFGIKKTYETLYNGIKIICGDIPTNTISAFVGIAGCTEGTNKSIIKELLHRYMFFSYGNDSDAANAVKIGLENSDGIAVIMKTESTVLSQCGGSIKRFGWYGPPFDNSFDCYELGKRSIIATLQNEQGVLDDTEISQFLKTYVKSLGIRIKDSLVDALPEIKLRGKPFISLLAQTVFYAYNKGDKLAKEILDNCISDLTRHIEAAAKNFDDSKKIKVVLLGNIPATFGSVISELIKSKIKNPDKYDIFASKEDIVLGALYLAKEKGDEKKAQLKAESSKKPQE